MPYFLFFPVTSSLFVFSHYETEIKLRDFKVHNLEFLFLWKVLEIPQSLIARGRLRLHIQTNFRLEVKFSNPERLFNCLLQEHAGCRNSFLFES